MDATDHPSVFLFSAPRTLSNLLVKLLSDQPKWNYGTYYFHDAFKYLKFTLGKTPLDEATPEQRKEYTDLLQRGFATLQADRENAQAKGVPIFIKNHAFQLTWPTRLWNGEVDEDVKSFCISACVGAKTNPTFLPDEILTPVIPLFIIRHPALVVESWYRTESRALDLDLSAQSWETLVGYDFCREIYDWFHEKYLKQMTASKGQGPFRPLIIDADDIIENDQAITKLCTLINMDPSLVPSEWEAQELPQNAWSRSYVQGLWNSTSIDKSKSAKGLNLEERYQKWRVEFGTEIAEYLIKFTERDLTNYYYLKERRL